MLKFGKVSHYLGYNAMDDFFPTMSLKPNKDCDDYFCRKQQEAFALEEAERLKNMPDVVEEEKIEDIVHEDNEWGISLVDDQDQPDLASNEQTQSNLAQGLSLAYERRVTMEAKDNEVKLDEEQSNEQSLDDLMKQMKQL